MYNKKNNNKKQNFNFSFLIQNASFDNLTPSDFYNCISEFSTKHLDIKTQQTFGERQKRNLITFDSNNKAHIRSATVMALNYVFKKTLLLHFSCSTTEKNTHFCFSCALFTCLTQNLIKHLQLVQNTEARSSLKLNVCVLMVCSH